MSEYFDELMTGLNEAVAIERGELNGRITFTNSIVHGFVNKGKEEVIRQLIDAKTMSVE